MSVALAQKNENTNQLRRTTSLLNEYGDTTIEWTNDVDETMIEFFRAKMAEGVNFYILDEKSASKTKIKSVFDIGSNRKVIVQDEQVNKVLQLPGITAGHRDSQGEVTIVGRAKSPEEAASKSTVGIKAAKGG